MQFIKKKSNICVYDYCKTRSTYNYDNESKALYCNEHKLANMIDIKHKKMYIQ